jgi:hypothetical protein
MRRLAATATLCGGHNCTHESVANTWSIARRGRIVEVGYGSGSDFPQYAAVHADSSFLRLNYGRRSQWGTSIVLLPSFWAAGSYYQGAPITVDWRKEGPDLVILFGGSISGLHVQGQIRLTPPASNSISVGVTVCVAGNVNLDRRPGEAFKLVALSSMHISADHWDARLVQVDLQSFPIPDEGWIIQPPVVGRMFALRAGSSTWKINAPTLEIVLEEAREITGWKADSCDPNDDNLGFWAATDQVIRFWQYTVTARQ